MNRTVIDREGEGDDKFHILLLVDSRAVSPTEQTCNLMHVLRDVSLCTS